MTVVHGSQGLAERLDEERAASTQALVERLGDEPLAWLALLPGWTERLAAACSFPEPRVSLATFLDQAQMVGWCTRRAPAGGGRVPTFGQQLLVDLAPGLPHALVRDEVLPRVLALADDRLKAPLLARLAPFLPQDVLADVRQVALGMAAPGKAKVATALVGRADPAERGPVVEIAEEAIEAIADAAERARSLVELVHASAGAVPAGRALEAVAGVPDPIERAALLVQLMPLLAPPQRLESLGSDRLEDDPGCRAEVLASAAPHLAPERTGEVVAELLDLTTAADEPWARAAVFDLLATALARSGDVTGALALAERIEDDHVRVHALGELIGHLNRSDADDLLADVVNRCERTMFRADGSIDVVSASRIVDRLATARRWDLAAPLAGRALDAHPAAASSQAAAVALHRIARALAGAGADVDPALAARAAAAALDTARSLGPPEDRAILLAGVSELLEGPARQMVAVEALAEAHAVHDDERRVRALARVLPLAGKDEAQEILDEILAVSTAGAADGAFAMPQSARPEVLDQLLTRRGFAWLQEQAGALGTRILEVRRRKQSPVLPAAARWAELAAPIAEGGTAGAAAALDERVHRVLRSGDTGPALRWLDTAAFLRPVLRGEFETAALADERRVELVHRRWLDRRHLEEFLPRREQDRAFAELMARESSTRWALHYLGMGGVGKTMLIRHISCELASRWGALTSRIDFDHLNPDFPLRRPGQLLLELAQELEIYAETAEQEQLGRRALAELSALDASDAQPGAVWATDHRDRAVRKAVKAFCGFLESLEKPVVLLLDTTEELAKFQPQGARLPQLEATFAIVELLHEALPSLRVVFAGRRLIAQAGTDWEIDPVARSEGRALLPEHKSYLALHEIRGFDAAEADDFLFRVKALTLPEDLKEAILAESRDTGTAATIVWQGHPAQAEEPRYNPFDLALHAHLAREAPDLDPATVAQPRIDIYIEARILQRLRDPALERLLPAVVLLRRFDRDMLRPAYEGSEEDFRSLYQQLGNLEWIDAQVDAALDTTFLEIDRSLRPRLEAHFHDPSRRSTLADLAGRLRPRISELVDSRPLVALGFDHVDADLRLAGEAAASRCDQLAWRVVDEQAWGWARRVIERVLGEDGALADPDHPGAAIARAVDASAMVHVEPDYDPSPLWQEVERSAANHPDATTGRWLERRAALGLLGRPDRPPPVAPPVLVERTIEYALTQAYRLTGRGHDRALALAGGALGAVERILDHAESTSRREDTPTPELIARIAGMAGLEHSAAPAYALLLAGRAFLLVGERGLAYASFASALDQMEAVRTPLPPALTADWLPPGRIVDRARLEVTRLTGTTSEEPLVTDEELGRWLTEAQGRLEEIDAERLASAILLARLARATVPASDLEELERLDDRWVDRRPLTEAHRVTPPLFVAVARGWLALGEADRAIAVLERRRSEALANRDAATVRDAEWTKLDVVRRMRLRDRAPALLSRFAASPEQDERELAGMVTALVWTPEAPTPGPPEETQDLHTWWRRQRAATPDAAEELATALAKAHGRERPEGSYEARSRVRDAGLEGDVAAMAIALDLLEASAMAWPNDAWVSNYELDALPWVSSHPQQEADAARLALRAWALMPSVPSLPAPAHEFVGRRRAAEIALEEGELLALRLPAPATKLLRFAATRFAEVGDPVGALLAEACALATAARDSAPRSTSETDPAAAQLRDRYERARSAVSGDLPAWDRLFEGDGAAVLTRLASLGPPDWQGWLLRVAVVQLWLSGDGEARGELSSWVSAQFGDQVPVELDLQPAQESPETAAKTSWVGALAEYLAVGGVLVALVAGLFGLDRLISSGVQTLLGRHPDLWDRSLGYALVLAIVLRLIGEMELRSLAWTAAVLGGVAVGVPLMTNALDAVGLSRSAWVRIPAYAVLAVAAITVVWPVVVLPRGIGRMVAGRPTASLLLDAPDPPDVRFRLLVRRSRLRFGWPLVSHVVALDTEATAPPPDFQAYSKSRAVGATEIGRAVGRLTDRVHTLPARVALEAPPSLAWLPWEAVLAPDVGLSSVSWWRREPALGAGGQVTGPPASAVTVITPKTWAPLVERAAGELRATIVTTAEGLGSWDPAPGLLVIVGNPVETVAGRRISASSGSALQEDEGDLLLEPDALPLRQFSAVIVQGEPGPAPIRTVPERERTGELRGCSAELMAAGASVVVFVPSLPVQLAEVVLDHLLGRLSSRSPGTGYVDAVDDVRNVIRLSEAGSDREREGLEELAMEVTVFARSAS